jgi:hypothetical protein
MHRSLPGILSALLAAGCASGGDVPNDDTGPGNDPPDASRDAVEPGNYPPDVSGWNCVYAPLVFQPIACATFGDCPANAPIRCPGEWVCADGHCIYGSRGICETVDSCPEGTVCSMSYDWFHDPANYPDSYTGICTQKPIACTTTGDCPAFPPVGFASGNWDCTNDVCAFPGFTPAYR